MINNVLVAGILSIFFLLPAAKSAEKNETFPDSVKQLVTETRKSIKTIDMAAFKAALDAQDYDLIVDVREPDEYAAGFIPGAVNIPRGVIEFKIWPYVGFPDTTDTGKKIIIYCKTGGRCTLAAKSLQDIGFTNVVAVTMKFKEWIEAGYPLEKDQ